MTNTFIVDKIFNKYQTFSGTHFPSSGQNRRNKCLKCTVEFFNLRANFLLSRKSMLKCDVACQNQAFVAEMSWSVMMFWGNNITLAFI